MNDPIVEEVRNIRAAHAARFNYDLWAIYRDLKEQQERSGLKFVSFADESIKAQPPAGATIPASHDNQPLPSSPTAEIGH
ncbi:MAG TPA: hypothetical protein VGP68_07430 [Gemmataceae bacterium]|jgi:hypothetical protein|nr:hypothetical protein [Gemmataceae bacterium]